MRPQKNLFALLLLVPILSVTLGCTGLTLGPQVRTEYVISHAGKPVQILENKDLVVRTLDGQGSPVVKDVGGWVAMPLDHWQALKTVLEKQVEEGKK